MKRTVKEANGRKYIIEEYINYSELIKTNDSREANFEGSGGYARNRSDNGWCGASYEKAVEMLRYGWEDKEKVKQISDTIKKIERTMDSPKMSFKNDIVGYAPIVPLALKGVPQNMINTTRKPKKSKVVNIMVCAEVSASVSVQSVLDWGAKLVANIVNLERNGYRVKIDFIQTYADEGGRKKVHVLKMPLKNENQPFDIKRMMFPLAHTAMLRRIGFDWYERLPEADYISGYGTPLIHWSRYNREQILNEVTNGASNSYLICCMENIDNVFDKLA